MRENKKKILWSNLNIRQTQIAFALQLKDWSICNQRGCIFSPFHIYRVKSKEEELKSTREVGKSTGKGVKSTGEGGKSTREGGKSTWKRVKSTREEIIKKE